MGRDKKTSIPTDGKDKDVVDFVRNGGSSANTGRGHRQRGAGFVSCHPPRISFHGIVQSTSRYILFQYYVPYLGTVITAKAPIVTQDGIVLKAHERLPCQILNEFCQREKRPMPKYRSNHPGHRYICHLEDPKNSKYDLEFAPAQSAESDKVARDYAALLALFHFQKSMPLER